MTTHEIIGVVGAVVVLIVDLVTDYQLWLKYRNQVKPEGSVKHKWGALIRIAALIPCVILAGWIYSPVILFGYWFFFDGIFNLLTSENFFRVGETAWIDKLQRKYPIVKWVKYIGFILSLIWLALWQAFNLANFYS